MLVNLVWQLTGRLYNHVWKILVEKSWFKTFWTSRTRYSINEITESTWSLVGTGSNSRTAEIRDDSLKNFYRNLTFLIASKLELFARKTLRLSVCVINVTIYSSSHCRMTMSGEETRDVSSALSQWCLHKMLAYFMPLYTATCYNVQPAFTEIYSFVPVFVVFFTFVLALKAPQPTIWKRSFSYFERVQCLQKTPLHIVNERRQDCRQSLPRSTSRRRWRNIQSVKRSPNPPDSMLSC